MLFVCFHRIAAAAAAAAVIQNKSSFLNSYISLFFQPLFFFLLPDGVSVAAGDDKGTVRVWSMSRRRVRPEETGTTTITTTKTMTTTTTTMTTMDGGHQSCVTAATFSPDGVLMCSASKDGEIKLWSTSKKTKNTFYSSSPWGEEEEREDDESSGKLVRTLLGHIGSVDDVSFSPNGALLCSGGSDRVARLWDVDQGVLLESLAGHEEGIRSVSFSPSGLLLCTGAESGSDEVRLWDIATAAGGNGGGDGDGDGDDGNGGGGGNGGRFGSGGGGGGGHDELTRQWLRHLEQEEDLMAEESEASERNDEENGSERRSGGRVRCHSLYVHEHGVVRSVAYSPDGVHICSATSAVEVWNARTGEMSTRISGHGDGGARFVSFSPGGTKVVTGGSDGMVHVWDAADGAMLQTFIGHLDVVCCARWSSDGVSIVSCGGDGTVRLWDSNASSDSGSSPGKEGEDGARGSGGSSGGGSTVVVRSCLQVLHGHAGTVEYVIFSPDNRWLCSCGSDGRVLLWVSVVIYIFC